MTCFNDLLGGGLVPTAQYTTRAMTNNSTASAGDLTGSALTFMTNTGGTPGTYTTRTAAQMMADWPLLVLNQTWLVVLTNNQGTGVLTLTAGSNVTVSGTATVAINSTRLFICTMNTATTITMVGAALGWLTTV